MPAQAAPDWPLFETCSPGKPGRFAWKTHYLHHLDAIHFFYSLSYTWHCLFRRQAGLATIFVPATWEPGESVINPHLKAVTLLTPSPEGRAGVGVVKAVSFPCNAII